MKIFIMLLVFILFVVPVSATEWHDESRAKRMLLTVNNSDEGLTDYQLMKNITYDSDMQPDFDDLLFYNETGTIIPYWNMSKIDSNYANIWLKIPLISTIEGAKVWMYYNNSSVGSASAGSDTFIQYHGAATSTFHDSNIITMPYVYEGLVGSVTSSGNLYFGLGDALTGYSIGNKIRILESHPENKLYLGTTLSGSSQHSAYSPGWGLGEYNNVKIVAVDSSHVYFYPHDRITLIHTSTTSIPTIPLGLTMHWGGGSGRQMWSFIRKYTATEPTWGADGEEESKPPVLNGTHLYPNSAYSIGYYGKLNSEMIYETGFDMSNIGSVNLLTSGDMEVLSTDDTNYIQSIDKTAANDGYMYGNFSLPDVKTVHFINIKTVHNRNGTNPVILGLFNTSTQKWYAVNNSSVETVDVELTYNITGTDIIKYTTLIDNILNLSVSLNTNGDGNEDVFIDFVEVYIEFEEQPDITLEYVYNMTVINQNHIAILQNDVEDLKNNVNNLYLFVLLCTVFLIATLRKRRDQ